MEENKAGSAYERKYAKAMEEGKRLRKAYRPRADIRRYLSSTFRLKADDLDGIMSTLYESTTKSAVQLARSLARSNKKFKWILDEIDADSTLEDLKGALDSAGYGAEYDRLVNKKARVKESLDGILDNSAKFRYMMLSRFVGDAKYYLAHEDRSERVLWSGNAVEHADNMVKLYDSFSEDEKPEWLTKPELDNYVKELYASVGKQPGRVREGIVSTKDGEKTFDELYGKSGIETDDEDGKYAAQFSRCFESSKAVKAQRVREAMGRRMMESLADMPDWMDGALREFLRENYRFDEEGGEFYGRVDPAADDELDEANIKKILASENPLEEFDAMLDNGNVLDSLDDEYTCLMVDLMHKFDDWAKDEGHDAEGAFEAWETDIDSWVRTNVHFSLNTSQYLKTDVHTVLIVDSGDGNYDFTLNSNFDDGEIQPEAGIVWLASTQGYSKEDLEAAVNDGEYKDSKFLKSVAKEVANCTTSMNAIAFLQDLELKDLIEREPGDVTVDTRTECGLFDPWNGAGGLFEIVLEKPVTVPKGFVRSYNVDGAFGSYSVGQVYGQWLG